MPQYCEWVVGIVQKSKNVSVISWCQHASVIKRSLSHGNIVSSSKSSQPSKQKWLLFPSLAAVVFLLVLVTRFSQWLSRGTKNRSVCAWTDSFEGGTGVDGASEAELRIRFAIGDSAICEITAGWKSSSCVDGNILENHGFAY